MAHSVLRFRGRSLRISDSTVLLVAKLLADQASRDLEADRGDPWLVELVQALRTVIDFAPPGVIDVPLDELLSDEKKLSRFYDLVGAAIDHLRSFGTLIPGVLLSSRAATFPDTCADDVLSRIASFGTILAEDGPLVAES